MEKENKKQVIEFGKSVFKVTDKRTTVAITVKHPDTLDTCLVDIEEAIPDGITVVHDSKTKTTFVGQFVHTNEVNELNEFREFVLKTANVYIADAIAFDTYKDTRNMLSNTLKNIDLDMSRVAYKPEQK